MTLLALIAEARAVREYLLYASQDPGYPPWEASQDRIIATLERLADSPYAPGIETALRTECGVAQPIVSVMDTVDPEAR